MPEGNEPQGLVPYQEIALLPSRQETSNRLSAIKEFQRVCHDELVDGHDFGIIPGTDKPTLLKPGAEKLAKLLDLADVYEDIEVIQDWDKPLFAFRIKCRLLKYGVGYVVSEGLGECNSMEARYRWRYALPKCPACGAEAIIKGKAEYGGGWVCFKKKGGCGSKYNDADPTITGQKIGRVENDDIFSQVNTIYKMAKKRALVDATLSACRLSDVFTQDIEDIAPVIGPAIPADPTIQSESEQLQDALFGPEAKHAYPSGSGRLPSKETRMPHWCAEHNIAFGKREKDGKVGYAHPIKGTSPLDWCTEKAQ